MIQDNPKPEPPILLTGKQAAALLSVSERTLYSLAEQGRIPRCRIGPRGIRYRHSDLLKFADSLATSA